MADTTDEFNRAALGADWSTFSGSPTLDGDSLSGAYKILRIAESFNSDHYSECVVNEASPTFGGPAVRMTDAEHYYYLFITGGSAQLWKNMGGSASSVGPQVLGLSMPAGSSYRLEAEGSTIRGYVNDELVVEQTDSDLATGGPGIVDFFGTAHVDSWLGGPIAGGGFQAAWAAGSNVVLQ